MGTSKNMGIDLGRGEGGPRWRLGEGENAGTTVI